VLGIVVGLVILAGVAFGASQLLGDDDAPPPPNVTEPATTGDGGTTTGTGAVDRAETAVVVLNGTPVNGLASQAREDLVGEGYTGERIATGNATDGQPEASQVLYGEGARAQARDAASVLDIEDVGPIDSETQALADSAGTEPADVVVMLGADRADPAP
jgi:hypothetical protein